MEYQYVNDVGKQWVRKYGFALSKEGRDQLKVINDIFLEYGNFEFETYNLKIYHKRSEGGISSNGA